MGDLDSTYQFYHPAVTVMWIAGLGLRIYALMNGWSRDELLNPPVSHLGVRHYPIEAGVVALGLTVAICIVISYVLLTRLANWPAAFCSGCFLALDPFFLAHSKVILTDTLLAPFMLVSMLAFLCYQQRKKWLDLVFSGLFAGLAFLTKSPSAFLFPYVLLLTVSSFLPLLGASTTCSSPKNLRQPGRLWIIVRTVGIWGVVASLVFVLAWPVMWSAPLKTISKIIQSVLFWRGEPHHDVFFAGQVVDDPGWLFYVATLGWKMTLITLPTVCIAVVFLLWRWREWKGYQHIWWLLIYAVGFFSMMTLSAKKGTRYLLPTIVALDVLAGWGLVQVARIIGTSDRLRRRVWIPTTIVVMALLVQSVSVLRHHPYYDVHHNLLLGGLSVAQHILPLGDQGEGLDLAARFLNGYPGAERRTAGLQKRFVDSFKRDFKGRTQRIGESEVDYWVFAVNANQRRLNTDQWEDMWEVCQRSEPLWSVSFDSVPYAWICPAYPVDPEILAIDHRLDVRLGDHIDLLGYQLSSTQLSAGDALTVTLFWQSDGRLVEDYHVFVHLVDADGQIAAQHDGVPVQGERPTWDWRDGEVFQDEHVLSIDPNLPGGVYTLSTGMYDHLTGVRLPAVSPFGDRQPEDRIVLQDLWVIVP